MPREALGAGARRRDQGQPATSASSCAPTSAVTYGDVMEVMNVLRDRGLSQDRAGRAGGSCSAMTAQSSLILPAYDGAELRRWALAAGLVFALHTGVVAGYVLLTPDEDDGSSDLPAVFVDLTPMASSSPSLADLPPGPEAPDAIQTPKPPEEIKPEVADPIQKIETPSEVMLPVPEPKAEEQKPQQEQQAPSVATAPPRAEQVGVERPAAAPQGSNASKEVRKRWERLISARLQQNKRFPSAAHGVQGTVTFAFVVNSRGVVLSQRIIRSSGNPAIDNEALAMLQRAQPLPAFLPGMPPTDQPLMQTISYSEAR